MKRISLLIRDEQYQQISDKGLNLSGLVRDLIDDHFSQHAITVSVGEETKELYDLIISNTGSTDADLEIYLKDTLRMLLKDKIQGMLQLEKKLDTDKKWILYSTMKPPSPLSSTVV